MLTSLKECIARDAVEINAAKLRIFSRINPPESLLEDENYQVDQDTTEFRILYGGKTAFRSPLRILGTWSHSRENFLWPWHNQSIQEKNLAGIREEMSALDELRPLLEQVNLAGESQHFFFDLCTWIAWRCGYQGVYPASYQGDVTVYLAVNLEPVDRDDSGRVCVMCLRREHQSDYFVAASEEFGICSNCIETLMDIAASDQQEDESLDQAIERICSQPTTAPVPIPCQLCRTVQPEVPVVAGPWTGVCYRCIQLVAGIHQEKSLDPGCK